jgi:hypothetical protein
VPGGITGPLCHWGTNTETGSSRLGVVYKTDDLALKKKITAVKSKEVKSGSDLAESYKEGCGSKRPVLSLMVMMIIIHR